MHSTRSPVHAGRPAHQQMLTLRNTDSCYSHNDVVDGNVDELDEETDEAHDGKPDGCRYGDLLELCQQAKSTKCMMTTCSEDVTDRTSTGIACKQNKAKNKARHTKTTIVITQIT